MTRQQSSFTQAVRHEQQGADDGFFGNADGPGPVSLSRKFSVRSGFGQNPEGAGRDEILQSPSPRSMRRQRSLISKQASFAKGQAGVASGAGKPMVSPMQGRRRLDANDRVTSAEMFDHGEIVMSDGKRGEGTPSVITPQMMMPNMRQPDYDYMRLDSGINKQDIN